VGVEHRYARIKGPARHSGLSCSCNDDVIRDLCLCIEAIRKHSGALRRGVSVNCIVDKEWAMRSRGHEPVHTTTCSRRVPDNHILDYLSVRLIDDVDASALTKCGIERDDVVLNYRSACCKQTEPAAVGCTPGVVRNGVVEYLCRREASD